MTKPRNSILGRNRKVRVSAGYQGSPLSLAAEPPFPHQPGSGPAPTRRLAQPRERMHFPKGYRPPPMVMSAGYPEKSFYAALTLPPLASSPHARWPVVYPLDRPPSRTAFADWLRSSATNGPMPEASLHDSNPAERCDVTA